MTFVLDPPLLLLHAIKGIQLVTTNRSSFPLPPPPALNDSIVYGRASMKGEDCSVMV